MALRECEWHAKIVVLEGFPEVFCTGLDFSEIREELDENRPVQQDPGPLFDLWTRLAHGPFVSVAPVRGRVNAGSVGFVAACDIVLSDTEATFAPVGAAVRPHASLLAAFFFPPHRILPRQFSRPFNPAPARRAGPGLGFGGRRQKPSD